MENKHEQRNHLREYTRHPVSVAINIHVENSNTIVHALMHDINIKGAGILSRTKLATGTSLHFFFEGMKLKGKVMRVCESQQDRNLFEMGVEFDYNYLGYFQKLSLKKLIGAMMDGKYEPKNSPVTETLKESIFYHINQKR